MLGTTYDEFLVPICVLPGVSAQLAVSAARIPTISRGLRRYLQVATKRYAACVSCLDKPATVERPRSTVRFHYLKVDGNGVPRFNDLALALVDHAAHYCFSAARRQRYKSEDELAALNREARALFRKMDLSGESGEILLYFMLEAVLGAPQLLAKMELKTNPKMEVHGSDGVHCRWDQRHQVLDLYFGEAKLVGSIYQALDGLLKSLENFERAGLRDHEIGLVTSHYKHANSALKNTLLDLIDRKNPRYNCRINHACLVGYNSDKYAMLGRASIAEMEEEFRVRYSTEEKRLTQLLAKRLGRYSRKEVCFEIFFLPFPTVADFRAAFTAAL